MPGLPASPIVGREAELDAVQRFVAEAALGPAALVLEGPAGIGKTAIWSQALLDARASGVVVRTCRCSQSDAGWAFAGLGDLLDGLDGEDLTQLPAVQRSALSVALLLSDAGEGTTSDRAVGVAVLGVLRAMARRAPLVLAIDDIQWLDPSSAKVLSFALRRLEREPIRLVASRRTEGAAGAAVEADLGLPGERLLVGPVSIGILQRIVRGRLSQS